jgi:signal transduction histidine kinase
MAMNPVLEQMLGGRSKGASAVLLADLVVGAFDSAIDGADRAQTQRLLGELIEGKRQHLQVDCKTADRNPGFLRWTIWRISGTKSIGSLMVMVEESSAPQAVAEHPPSERLEMVGRLAGGVAHDFNNLLTGILLYCDLLAASLDPGHCARKYTEEIRSAGLQTTSLVRQLLTLARPANVQPRLVLFNDIAESMRNLLVRLIGENIQIDFDLDSEAGLVCMDVTQAQQVLLNLVLNARDAMPNGGRIKIETRNCKLEATTASAAEFLRPCVLLVVEDNGCGMDAATREHVFEPFFTTKGAKGTGLGLATVHDIVTGSGGLISVHSELGRGTRISLLLPVVREDAESRSQSLHSQVQKNEVQKDEVKPGQVLSNDVLPNEVLPKQVPAKQIQPKLIQPKQGQAKQGQAKQVQAKQVQSASG